MKIAILGTRGIPNNYGGFEQCAEYLSIGLIEKGHHVTVYSPDLHPYKEETYKGIQIIRKPNLQSLFGSSASSFIYDYLCFKDAVGKDFDIILELGLITSALSIIFCNHKNKVIVTNLDGLEWKRLKWNNLIQKITKKLEKYGVKYSDYLIADNVGIQEYILDEYNRNSEFISYGATNFVSPSPNCLKEYGIVPNNYLLSVARLEPENNLEIMFDGYITSKVKNPYFVVGNHLTEYGDFLKDKYRNTGIIFLGGIFNKIDLDNIRYYSIFYLHGHSVGGTNPALLEAMATNTFILAHDNIFNKSVVKQNAYYFKNANALSTLIKDKEILKDKLEFAKNNLNRIEEFYSWSSVVNQYESYFKRILDNK